MVLSLMGNLHLRMWEVLLYHIVLRHRRSWTFGIWQRSVMVRHFMRIYVLQFNLCGRMEAVEN